MRTNEEYEETTPEEARVIATFLATVGLISMLC